jgi:hypothetical protein
LFHSSNKEGKNSKCFAERPLRILSPEISASVVPKLYRILIFATENSANSRNDKKSKYLSGCRLQENGCYFHSLHAPKQLTLKFVSNPAKRLTTQDEAIAGQSDFVREPFQKPTTAASVTA